VRALLCLICIGCGGSSGALQKTETPSPRFPEIDWIQPPEPVIDGTWILHVEVVEAGKMGHVGPYRAEGQVDLQCQTPRSRPRGRPCPNNYQGTYDSSLALLFGPPLRVPLRGVTTPQGMVELATNPERDHGSYRLQGMMRHDSIIGEWGVTGYVPGSNGRFVMTRR
jgi:hypothetical protein